MASIMKEWGSVGSTSGPYLCTLKLSFNTPPFSIPLFFPPDTQTVQNEAEKQHGLARQTWEMFSSSWGEKRAWPCKQTHNHPYGLTSTCELRANRHTTIPMGQPQPVRCEQIAGLKQDSDQTRGSDTKPMDS